MHQYTQQCISDIFLKYIRTGYCILGLPMYMACVIFCTLRRLPHIKMRKFTESTRPSTMLLHSGTRSRYTWKITVWIESMRSHNLSLLLLHCEIINNFAMGTKMKAVFPYFLRVWPSKKIILFASMKPVGKWWKSISS